MFLRSSLIAEIKKRPCLVALFNYSGAAPATVSKRNLINAPLCNAREGGQADADASLASPETGHWLASLDVTGSRRCGGQRTGKAGLFLPRLFLRPIAWVFAGVRSENPS